jgi:hypothetical protein
MRKGLVENHWLAGEEKFTTRKSMTSNNRRKVYYVAVEGQPRPRPPVGLQSTKAELMAKIAEQARWIEFLEHMLEDE